MVLIAIIGLLFFIIIAGFAIIGAFVVFGALENEPEWRLKNIKRDDNDND